MRRGSRTPRLGIGSGIRICAINGSSRVDGQTARRLSVILKDAEKLGAHTRLIHLAKVRLAPCDGSETPRLRRDFRGIFEALSEADGIIFGTPTYWFNMSGLMKNFLDRLTVMERHWTLDHKVAGFVATGHFKEDGAMIALSSLAATVNGLGMVVPPYALLYFQGSGSAWARSDWRKYAGWMIDMINLVRHRSRVGERKSP